MSYLTSGTHSREPEAMIVTINNRLRLIPLKTIQLMENSAHHIHCEKALQRQILRLHKEGWQIANIASIAQCKPDVVQQVLKDKDILM
jgi:hypothetical protein